MLEHHERDDVAAGSMIFLRVDELAELGQVAAMASGSSSKCREGLRPDEIAAMRLRAVLAGDVPARPAIGERRAVVMVLNSLCVINSPAVIGARCERTTCPGTPSVRGASVAAEAILTRG